MNENFYLVYVTAKDHEEGKKIAIHLIEKKLAACANIFPISSFYTWKKKLVEDNEVGIFIKTRKSLIDELISEIKKIHSYDVPCIVSFKIEKGYTPYLNWILDSTKESTKNKTCAVLKLVPLKKSRSC